MSTPKAPSLGRYQITAQQLTDAGLAPVYSGSSEHQVDLDAHFLADMRLNAHFVDRATPVQGSEPPLMREVWTESWAAELLSCSILAGYGRPDMSYRLVRLAGLSEAFRTVASTMVKLYTLDPDNTRAFAALTALMGEVSRLHDGGNDGVAADGG